MDQKKNKRPNGRPTLDQKIKRKYYKYYLNEKEEKKLVSRMKDSRYSTKSEFVRSIILAENDKPRHLHPVQFFNDIGALANQVNKVGVNVNQLAKFANEMALQNMVRPELLEDIKQTMQAYTKQQEEIMSKLKELITS